MSLQNYLHTEEVYLGIGTNLGQRAHNLLLATQYIEDKIGVVSLTSSIFETEPWGYKDQPSFFNQCICVQTQLSPRLLLRKIHEIERTIGRKRVGKWGKRLIDIDILFYNQHIIDSKAVKIPHPYLHLRKFVLLPLMEINPFLHHPVYNKSIQELVEICPDSSAAEIAITQSHEPQLHSN